MTDVPRRTRIFVEDKEMIAIFEWINFHQHIRDYAIHIPNEGKRTLSQNVRLKKMGLKKGVSDIFIAIPNNNYYGLWIEHKSMRANGKFGKATEEQIEFVRIMNKIGYFAKITYGIDDAINTIRSYLSMP